MSETAERWKSQLATLPESDRAELPHYLLRSLDAEAESDVEAAWELELRHRLTKIEKGDAGGEPAEQIFVELRRRYA